MDKEQFENALMAYVSDARADLAKRWESWPLNLEENEAHEAIGALLARQVTLATNLARSPGVWNGHVAPILLRSMADVYITCAWILEDPLSRSRQFIRYGLGQAKLQIEHRKAQAKSEGDNPDDDPVIEALERWVNSQRFLFLTEVDIGAWSGLSTRQMAEEASCLDYYRYVYMPFSASVHSMWHHIGRLNLEPCMNPLHRGHYLPVDPDLEVDVHYLYLAAKYLDKTFGLFDEKIQPSCERSTSFEKLMQSIRALSDDDERT